MTEKSFYAITSKAFYQLSSSYDMTQSIEQNKVIYSCGSIKIIIYFENFFEINVFFQFFIDTIEIQLSLEELAVFLGFNDSVTEFIRSNQVYCDQYYNKYIVEISNICTLILKDIYLKEQIIINCHFWKLNEQRDKILKENREYIERKLEELWKKKKYLDYLELYSKNIDIVKQSSKYELMEKRKNYVADKTGDGSVSCNDR